MTALECTPCLDPVGGATCSETTTRGTDILTHGSTSLATVRIEPNHWRLSARSTRLSVCLESSDGKSPCKGGTDAGDEGSGYCKAGHTGPLCQVCSASDYYFDDEAAMECLHCPAFHERLHLPMGIFGGLFALLWLSWICSHFCGERLHGLVAKVKRVVARIRQLDLVPRCKLLFTFFQIASQITTVYHVKLTGSAGELYQNSVAFLSWATIDFDGWIFPGQCIGFRFRLLLRALVPIVLLIAIPMCVVAFFGYRRARGLGTRGRWLRDALVVAAPFDLFVSFVLCPTVSKGIFDTWDCTKYELDGATGDVRTFLNEDLRVVCGGNDHPEQYDEIKYIAYFFLLIWPIGMPLIGILVLLPIRKALRQNRNSPMVQATAFLHREYRPTYFWWDLISLFQRLVLTGWVVFFIPIESDVWRIFIGLLTTIGYLSLIQFVQPYKRADINTLAIATQFSLVCVFLGGAFIKLLSGDGTESVTCDGNDASCASSSTVFTIVVIMVVFNFSVLTLYVSLTVYQLSTTYVLPSIRLVATSQVPELKLEEAQRYHLFLSHVWSSGQDQMATVKRELQLLLNDVRVYLDVDELEELGQLDTCVKQTQSMLFFLSKGFFFSANCRKEVAATLSNGNPIILLRETDPNRGGAPMDQLVADCPDEWRKEIFVVHRPVIPWFRVKDFKLVSLKMIVSSMLLYQSKLGREMHAPPEDREQLFAGRLGVAARLGIAARRNRSGSSALPRRPPSGVVGDDEEDVATATATSELSSSGTSSSGAGAASSDLTQIQDLGGSHSSTSSGPPREKLSSTYPPRAISNSPRTNSDPFGLRRIAMSPASSRTARSTTGRRASRQLSRRNSTGQMPDLNTLGADLYVSGEVTQQQLGFPTRTTLIVSAKNSGAVRLAQEILTKYPDLRTEAPDPSLGSRTSRRPRSELLGWRRGGLGGELSPRSPKSPRLPRAPLPAQASHVDKRKRVFLLYLTQETWLAEAGSELAHQVRATRAAGISVVLVHECDPTLGACEFSSLFQATPQDLIADGLYARTAVAFHTGQHRAVSLSLFAREIGAVRYRLGIMKPRNSRGGVVVEPLVGPASLNSSFSTSGYLGSAAGSRYLGSSAGAGAHYLGSQAADRARDAVEAEHLSRASSFLNRTFELPVDCEGGRFGAKEAGRLVRPCLALSQLVSSGSGWPASEEGKPSGARHAARKWLANAELAAAEDNSNMGGADDERMAAPGRGARNGKSGSLRRPSLLDEHGSVIPHASATYGGGRLPASPNSASAAPDLDEEQPADEQESSRLETTSSFMMPIYDAYRV